MTREELIELSKQAAEVLGIEAYVQGNKDWIHRSITWLAEDSGRCAEIAADKSIDTTWYDEGVQTLWSDEIEFYSDHNGDRLNTWRVAVLKAVIEQGKQS